MYGVANASVSAGSSHLAGSVTCRAQRISPSAANAGVGPVRRWAVGVDVRALVALHVTRLVAGGYFLVVYYRDGQLPYAFAVPGGSGDMLVALLAVALLVTTSPRTARGRWLYAG